MAEERFEDKQLAKKTDAKIKGEAVDEKANPHEQAKNALKPAEQAAAPAEKAKTEGKTAKTDAKGKEKANAEAKDAKPAKKFVLERKYTVNLTDAYAKPKYKRADKAISLLREFALRHMKGKNVKVSVELNNTIRTSSRPQKKVQIVMQKDEAGTVFAALAQKS